MAAPHGLTETQWAIVQDVLARFASQGIRFAVFGSRATGRARRNSDIDLVVYGTDAQTADDIKIAFDESPLVLTVDVVAYEKIANPALKAHIDRVAVPLAPLANPPATR